MKNLQRIYFLSLFLFIIPSFNFSFIYTHGISKLILIFLFIKLIFNLIYRKRFFKLKDKRLFFLFTIYFLSQSFSIIKSNFVYSFLSRFKDLIFVAIFFIVGVFLFSSEKDRRKWWFLNTLILSSFFNTFFQILIFFYPNFFINIALHLFYPDYLELIIANIERGRIYFSSFEEILIPICFYYIFKTSDKKTRIFFTFYIFIILFISFVSNFRSKFLMVIFALITSIILYRKYLKKYFFITLLSLFIFFSLISSFMNQKIGFSLIDRFLFINELRDILTITSRKEQIFEGFQIGMFSPIFGIGLGNYPFYTNNKYSQLFLSKSNRALKEGAVFPHNVFILIFAETGLFGIISFLLIIFYFIKKDLTILMRKNFFKKSIVISFWTIFIYALFNPTISLQFNIIFWVLRIFLI
jgi:hypothetical protein